MREWTLGNVIKINILFESGMELKVEVCSVDEILVIISIEMIFKAKKLDCVSQSEDKQKRDRTELRVNWPVVGEGG